MTTSDITPGEALAVMRERWRVGSTNYARLCLKHVRTVYNIPAKEATAREARENATSFHKYDGNPESIPYGAFVFSRLKGSTGTAEHVFLAGGHAGKGKRRHRIFWTNDAVTLGGTSPVKLSFFVEKWSHEILGWTNNVNGVQVVLKSR